MDRNLTQLIQYFPRECVCMFFSLGEGEEYFTDEGRNLVSQVFAEHSPAEYFIHLDDEAATLNTLNRFVYLGWAWMSGEQMERDRTRKKKVLSFMSHTISLGKDKVRLSNVNASVFEPLFSALKSDNPVVPFERLILGITGNSIEDKYRTLRVTISRLNKILEAHFGSQVIIKSKETEGYYLEVKLKDD